MFINKINGIAQNLGFKGYQHIKNDVGETIMKFNYPYDYKNGNESCEIEIYNVTKTDKLNYKVSETPIATIRLEEGGKEVNLQRETNLDKDETFAYRVVRKDKNGKEIWSGADSGIKILKSNGEYVFRVHNEPIGWIPEKNKTITDRDGNPITVVTKDDKEINQLEVWHKSDILGGPKANLWKLTLVTQNGTTPFVQGPGYLAMPDTFMPGVRYKAFNEEGTGEIVEDWEYQEKMEKMVKTVSNMYGGSIAGLEAVIPHLKKMGIKKFFTTPLANGDNRTSHGYYNKNNMQVQENMGNSENFDSLMRTEFRNGINHVFDATLTSEGIEGIHVNYVKKWGDKAQSARWFRMYNLNDLGLAFGVVPNEPENLRHRLINSPFIVSKQGDGTYKFVENKKYNKNKETYLQIYDASQVTESQLAKTQRPIDMYRELDAGKDLKITSYDDTTIPYVYEINPDEYKKNVVKINNMIKDGQKIELNSPEGTMIASAMTNYRNSRLSEGYVAWDDNPDMIKLNYGISAYDEKELQAITDLKERENERNNRRIASKEVQDMAVQVGKYWAEKAKTADIIYTAQTLGKIKTAEGIDKLIKDELLPNEVKVSQKVINNVINSDYLLSPKCVSEKDDITINALMKLPLDSLEFGENTVSVLSTSYFSNRATTDETIGVSRFDLMKQDNPHLLEKYAKVYNRVNKLYANELKFFAEDVLAEVNKTSEEPLFDADNNYTEYGEYVAELLGSRITKYALLKSLAGDKLKFKILPDGALTYDYKSIKSNTSLKALGINASSPEEEAEILENKIHQGLKKLNKQDIENVANSIKETIKGTDVNSFRLAEALVERSGLGLDFRLDAAKDVMDMDSVRNRIADFNDVWTELISFWKKFVQGIKSVNPHSYIVAEMTDVNTVSGATYGANLACPYNGWTNINSPKFNGEPDAMTKFFIETGITSEAAYSYFFTELLTSFSADFEKGNNKCDFHDDFKKKYDLLINSRSVDFLRNLYTFIGNHDKTRTIHGLAIDMALFHSHLQGKGEQEQREKVIQVLSGANNINEVPLELKLNLDNPKYFRTVSARAVAQSKVIMDSINEDLSGIASPEDIKLLKEAIIDITNGNYLVSKNSEKMTKIKLPQISSIENAVSEVAKLAQKYNIYLTDEELRTIIDNANSLNYKDYLIEGELDDATEYGTESRNHLSSIMGNSDNADKYSIYTLQIARMIKTAVEKSNIGINLNDALKDFIKTYNKELINDNTDSFKMYEAFATSRKKDSYAANDFRIALEEIFKQAEFKSGKTLNNKDLIMAAVYNSITEPAIEKQAYLLTFLGALCGIPTIFAGDEYGDTGYEDKSKNPNVKNRMASRLSEIVRGTLMGKIMERNRDYTLNSLNGKSSVKPLQNGTSYSMDFMINNKNREEILARINELEQLIGCTKDSEKRKEFEQELNEIKSGRSTVAYLMQGANGDMAVSVFNASGIEHGNRVDYFKKYGIHTDEEKEQFIKDNNIQRIENMDSPELNNALRTERKYNPYVPMQKKTELDAIIVGAGITIPAGTVFYNICKNDKTEYITKMIKDKIGIVRADGKKIVMDGLTSRHGVLMLTSFRGREHSNRFYNKQFNIVSCPYQKAEAPAEGKKLSVIVK